VQHETLDSQLTTKRKFDINNNKDTLSKRQHNNLVPGGASQQGGSGDLKSSISNSKGDGHNDNKHVGQHIDIVSKKSGKKGRAMKKKPRI